MAKKRPKTLAREELSYDSKGNSKCFDRLVTIEHVQRWAERVKKCLKLLLKYFLCLIISTRLLAALSSVSFVQEELESLARNLLGVNSHDQCLLSSSAIPLLDNMFIEPFNCSICRDLDAVDVVTNISEWEFTKRYAYSAVPVVVKHSTKGWKAMEAFSLQFLQKIYTQSINNNQDRCQFFPYKTGFASLNEAFSSNLSEPQSASSFSRAWYIGWSNCDPRITKMLRKYYRKPSFLPSSSSDSRLDWMFMGSPGYGASMHIDHVGHPSWQAQIRGSKQWTLQPPAECLFSCKTLTVRVSSGDIIVLDTDKWFHETKIIGSQLSITIGSEYD